MEWIFKLRGKSLTFEIVDDVVAVQVGDRKKNGSPEPESESSRILTSHNVQQDKTGANLPPASVRIFEKAGWRFLSPEDAKVFPRPAHRVLLTKTEGILLETELITVQVLPEISKGKALEYLKSDQLTVVRTLEFGVNLFETRSVSGKSMQEIIGRLQDKTKIYAFAEPSFLQIITGRMDPTDPGFVQQWHHFNDGSLGGTAGADIRSKNAWDVTRGRNRNRPVRIAIVDSGMQVDHPDLRDGIIGGGYFSANNGSSPVFVSFNPGSGADNFPNNNHGTFCLGMAGARLNNDEGVCGSAPESHLFAVACLDDMTGTQATLARAIAYAADPRREDANASQCDGADVISCSLGPDGDQPWYLTSVLDMALTFASTSGRNGLGALIFWAVNNAYRPIVEDEVCSHPGVIAIGKSNRYDRSDGSAYGEKLEFLAPGSNVYSTRSNGRYGSRSGTSFAAPLAAGVGALVLSIHPEWTRDQALERLRTSCDKIGGVNYVQGRHNDYGYGRINAERAVRRDPE